MHSRLSDFIEARAAETYPEPRTFGHDDLTRQMAEIVAKHLPIGARIWDVGCGEGPALEWFTAHGFKPFGTCMNSSDRDACLARGYEVRCEDMHENYVGDSAVDCVWARHVLEHSVIPFFVLHEFARVLKPGGILYAEMPAPETACLHENNPNHYSVLTLGMWQSLISRAGFDILETRRICLATGAGPDVYHSIIAKKL